MSGSIRDGFETVSGFLAGPDLAYNAHEFNIISPRLISFLRTLYVEYWANPDDVGPAPDLTLSQNRLYSRLRDVLIL